MYLSKQNFIKRKLEILQKSSANQKAQGFEDTIGILVNADEFSNYEFLRNLGESILKDVPVEILAYSKTKSETSEENVILFSNSDFKLTGVVKSAKLSDFVAKPFRFLISYYQRENVFLHFLKASSKGAFKIGVQQQASACFQDLTIDCNLEQTEVFKSEVLKYLKIVNRID